MKITLVRTGGVAGMRRTVELDTDDLDPVRARELERLVAAANLQRLSEPTLAAAKSPDRLRYKLTVVHGARKHTVTFDEHRIPEAVKPLIEAVWSGASSGPGTVTA